MSLRTRDAMMQRLAELRHEPTDKRVRAMVGDQPVVDSRRALLVWEPRRIVPSYAVPTGDVRGELVSAPLQADEGQPVLHPGIRFAVHSTAGEAFHLRVGAETRDQAAFRPADADLAGHVVLDHNAFDAWLEEDEPIHGHPRDPFHRVDTRRSSRHVRIEVDGHMVAESTRPTLVFETGLPTRFYLPREDFRAQLSPTTKHTYCPYKGRASYWAFEVDGRRVENLVWSYEDPLPDAAPLTGLLAFYDERVDVVLDGERRERPDTVFSRVLREEFGV
jgi:uncharacterized protein (DUF427 family)